jgi:hypothetical protein
MEYSCLSCYRELLYRDKADNRLALATPYGPHLHLSQLVPLRRQKYLSISVLAILRFTLYIRHLQLRSRPSVTHWRAKSRMGMSQAQVLLLRDRPWRIIIIAGTRCHIRQKTWFWWVGTSIALICRLTESHKPLTFCSLSSFLRQERKKVTFFSLVPDSRSTPQSWRTSERKSGTMIV